jgi:hypothetical protein
MRMSRRWLPVLALAAMLVGGSARADNNPNGQVFRAVGFYQGRSTISAQSISCEIPTISTAINDGAYSFGMWNTYGVQTLMFPDINSPIANPCGGWMQLQNNLLDQGIVVDRIALRFRVKGAKRFRSMVPTRGGFPRACRKFRRDSLFTGVRLDPINAEPPSSISGAPNVAFVQLLPMLSPQLIHCLRSQYAPLPTSVFVSLPLVITATAYGTSDSGDSFRTNPIRYTVSLRHTCGNGRVDDGEQCDPNAPDTCIGFCDIGQGAAIGKCTNNESLGCRSDSDCAGVCVPQNQPSECICVY